LASPSSAGSSLARFEGRSSSESASESSIRAGLEPDSRKPVNVVLLFISVGRLESSPPPVESRFEFHPVVVRIRIGSQNVVDPVVITVHPSRDELCLAANNLADCRRRRWSCSGGLFGLALSPGQRWSWTRPIPGIATVIMTAVLAPLVLAVLVRKAIAQELLQITWSPARATIESEGFRRLTFLMCPFPTWAFSALTHVLTFSR